MRLAKMTNINLIYLNRFNETKAYEVEIIEKNSDYYDVYDLREKKVKTFKAKNILSTHKSYDEAINAAIKIQSDYGLIKRNKTGVTWANPDKKFEVCFTGFLKIEKEELILIAKKNNMFIRTDVSKKLGLLVCGEKAGWAKLKKANKMNIARVFGKDGFLNFLSTGEFVE